MTDDSGNFAVWLTRIEGKMDLSNLRHDQTDAWKITVDQRLHRHSNDISTIQARWHLQDGERKGLALAGKAIHWLTGGGVVAIIAAILRTMNV